MITFISTVYNEENSITKYLRSLGRQTKLPDEVVIVDAGSLDKTIELINKEFKQLESRGIKTKLIVSNGANRSVGRNIAIKSSSGDIIVGSDAGCILKSDWLEEITRPFNDPKTDVVSGFYYPEVETNFQKSVAPFFCVMPESIPDSVNYVFLPSSRSVAFRKTAWEKVGGYPESLNYCEDLFFDQSLVQNGLCFKFAKKALVLWPQRKTLSGVYRQFYNYAVGDGMVFFHPFQTHSLKIASIFFRYLVFAVLAVLTIAAPSIPLPFLILVFLYLAYPVLKLYKYVRHPLAFLYLPLIQITGDIAVMLGALRGVLKKI